MTDGRTDGRTDGGDCNIPIAFLKKRGDKKKNNFQLKSMWSIHISCPETFLISTHLTQSVCKICITHVIACYRYLHSKSYKQYFGLGKIYPSKCISL